MKTYQLALIGNHLDHTISKQIHEKLFELSGTVGEYTIRDIEPENLEKEIEELKKLDGFNVTIPYKQKIIPYLDALDVKAKRYNAVNTVKCENGKLTGYNTDVDGFLHALKAANIELEGEVLLCGAGGVARMMAYEALDRGCNLTIATPLISEAQNFIYEIEQTYPNANVTASTLTYLSGSFDVILNGTPVGMFPNASKSPVPVQVSRSAKAVFDAVYNPVKTTLIKKSAAGGAKVQSGLTMLIRQAVAAQAIIIGSSFKDEDLNAVYKEMEYFLNTKF
jgi:shikimate dehydrogenase